MAVWQLVDREEDIKQLVIELKNKDRKNFRTNYLFYGSEKDEEYKYTEAFYCQTESAIFLLERIDEIYKFSYFCLQKENISKTDIEFHITFPSCVSKSKIVCDIIEDEGREKQNEIRSALIQYGFIPYKKYYLWEGKRDCIITDSFRDENVEFRESNRDELAIIYDLFDPTADNLPIRKMFDLYCDSCVCKSCYVDKKYMGSIIYKIKGHVSTAEYLYIINPSKGIGTALYNYYIQDCANNRDITRFLAWIEENNVISKKIHEKRNYKQIGQSKEILLYN